jgi:tetratricopeptide (TPR) repeat protein
MLDSGVLAPQMMGQVQFLAGVTAYQQGDYAGAVKYLEPAKASGYQDQQGLLDRVLADAYKRTGNASGALAMAQRDIAAAKAAGTKPSETAIRTALQAAYDGKQVGPSIELAVLLVQDYPSASAWNNSINVVRALSGFQSQEVLDLMRLMARTGALSTEHDYVEYLQAVDPRRLPGEAQKILEAGLSSGKLRGNDPFVTEARQVAGSRVAADRASLPGLERDARAANATASTVSGAADAFLSYGDAAKAEALYTAALGKPGVDTERVQTRLGIAQLDQGKAAEAQATFAKVQGPRKPIAQLWSAYAGQKAAGGGAATAAAQ